MMSGSTGRPNGAGGQSLTVIHFNGAIDAVFARQLDAAFSGTGFCYPSDVGVGPALPDGTFDASGRFHALPRSVKRMIAVNRFHRACLAPTTSMIETSAVAHVTRPNDSGSFMITP
jgi:isopenicillin N synthase-like dioxygenase